MPVKRRTTENILEPGDQRLVSSNSTTRSADKVKDTEHQTKKLSVPADNKVKFPVDTSTLKRNKPAQEEIKIPAPPPLAVSAGPVDKAMELAFNPTREKIREVTVVDWMQGRLFPLLDSINSIRRYIIEIATYRQSAAIYATLYGRPRPIVPDIADELVYRTAQWQKSVKGVNLARITEIALAEKEAGSNEDDGLDADGRSWED